MGTKDTLKPVLKKEAIITKEINAIKEKLPLCDGTIGKVS